MSTKTTEKKETKPYQDRDWLYQKYWIEGLDRTEIACLCGMDQTRIFYWMKKNKIPARSRSEVVKREWRKGIYKNKKRARDFSGENQKHRDMKKLAKTYIQETIWRGYKILEEHQEGKYVYDLYIQRDDLPIEVGKSKIEKLENLIKKKRLVCVVPYLNIFPGGAKGLPGYLCDWLRGHAYCLIFNYKDLTFIFISKYKLPEMKRFVEWSSF